MIYLSQFSFPDIEEEYDFLMAQARTCYDSYYPFQIISKHRLRMLDFEPVTFLYGGNGSGKTTVLNCIAEKLRLNRDTRFNRTDFFEDYTRMCSYTADYGIPEESRIITSDDVFDFILNMRAINDGIDEKREELFEEYLDAKYSDFRMKSLEDYDRLKKVNMARRKTQSRYVRNNLMDNAREHSNGESAFLYFSEKIKEDGLYLLDEPLGGVDPVTRREILRELMDSMDGTRSILLSTHLVHDMEPVLDEAVFLRHGAVALYASAEEIRAVHGCSVEERYLHVFGEEGAV